MRLTKYRPTPAMVVAIVALMVALGGTSYAAIKLPKNSVGTKQIKNRAVTGSKIGNNAVQSSKVKDSSLLKKDFAPGQLPAVSQGPAGKDGPAGRNGTNGATNVTLRTQLGTATAASVSCNPGERATGGGGAAAPGSLLASQPTTSNGSPTGWSVNSNGIAAMTVYVICASP